MITKDASLRAREGWIGVLILLAGVVIGAVAQPARWFRSPTEAPSGLAGSEPITLISPMAPTEKAPAASTNGLPTLIVELADDQAAILQRLRTRSLERGMIFQDAEDLVTGTVALGDKTVPARMRIKGDFLDHIDTKKWSLRIELKGDKLLGMSRFSIQHPKTRGHLWEWLIMSMARRDGLLAPRSHFVNVIVNNNPTGIYYLEEHLTKELLESQGRREGPIVRFVEDTYWAEYHQHRQYQGAGVSHLAPVTIHPSQDLTAAEISAYGEKRLAQSEALARQLQSAIDKMRDLQRLIRKNDKNPLSQLAKLQALVDTHDLTIDHLVDVDSSARMHGLLNLFRCNHALVWPNRRFYHNPITARLEPIVFDTLAGTPIAARDPIAMASKTTTELLKSDRYYNRLFELLGPLSESSYLDDHLAALRSDLERFARLLQLEGMVSAQTDPARMINQLRDQQVFLQELLRPTDGANFESRLLTPDFESSSQEGLMEVEAWATTKVPVVVEGFRFSNGRFIGAHQSLDPQSAGSPRSDGTNGVVLPHDGRHAVFRFRADGRLTALRDIQQLKDAVRRSEDRDRSVKLRVLVEYHYLPRYETRTEPLSIRRFAVDWTRSARPDQPVLREALEAHQFLEYDHAQNRLSVKPGVWTVEGDLLVPADHRLHIGPGVTLKFEGQAALVSTEPLVFEGRDENPIVLEPVGDEPWAGVVVLDAEERSRWSYVRVRGTDTVQRGGWILTGGVTFYRSPVDLLQCHFTDARGEDALNIYDADFRMDNALFDGVASDAFDGDFVTGTVTNSIFRNSGEDAVDVSGSRVHVATTRFVEIGDKAISAGEDSEVQVTDSVVESASIAVASKDFSRVEIEDLEIQKATQFGLAAYVKKPEFGPSSIVSRDTEFGTCGRGRYLVQTHSRLTLDGEEVETADIDVEALYRQKILGQ